MSVIIPAYNEAKHIGASVASARQALAQTARSCPDLRWRVIVVDNNSTDATATIASGSGADLVLFEPINQIARARNAGATAALERVGAGPDHWLIFLDADSRLGPALLMDVIDSARSGQIVGGGAVVQFDPPIPALRTGERLMNWGIRVLNVTPGAFIFCRADAFAEIGGFDRRLYAAEDAKIGSQMKRWGRSRGLRMVILHRNAVITSSRKFALYRPHEFASLILRALLNPAALRDRSRLPIFYDGRR
ncbi:MAG TPA: glycosyltransferase [Tepidisphaeraceae bacterium]